MKSRFEPDVDSGARLPPATRLIDPEAYDASEQCFAASVEEKPAPTRFVVDAVQEPLSSSPPGDSSPQVAMVRTEPDPEPDKPPTSLGPPELLGSPDSGSWRSEVAARVGNYRARRRPRTPRYPSLQLKFDPPGPSWTAQAATDRSEATAAPSRLAVAMQDTLAVREEEQSIPPGTEDVERLNVAEASARILEFPRSAASPQPVV